ncbi:MAG: fibronectin type III domain-containing protein, partial [Bacteroidales bacterium]|nr:fibronectin type III domain-containing protein [Bacteroidales bacterium]
MSKRLLFALGLGIALTGFAPAASAQLVWQRVEWARGLAAGTSSTMVPFNHSGSFAYTYVETIYDNDSLVLASGTYIDTVWFYCTAVGDPVPNDASVEIRISTTPLSAHSTVKGWLTGSTAASATFATTLQPTTTGWFPIKLDTPFEYTGEDNLVITVYRNGSDGTGQTYAGITTAATRTTLGYGGASAWSATQPGNRGHAHRPDLRLSVRAPRVNKPVENLAAAGSTQTTATVDWSVNAMALEPVGYKIEYGPRGFTEGTGTKIITTDGTATSHTVEELAAATWYDVYVSAIAGPADTSASRKVSLATG